MADFGVSVPSKRVSAWSVETNPKYARAWLTSLSPVDNMDSARELYQSLYALNRMELDVGQRFELVGLYRGPVQEVVNSFQTTFGNVSFPMSNNRRQLAEFICQLHVEMAYGYKLCVHDLPGRWLPWRRRQLLVPCAERALYHLGEVLRRSYQLYLPYPPGVWRDAHALYRFAEHHGQHEDLVSIEEESGTVSVSVSQRYRRLLMLGIAGPYQMPFNECASVYRFLGNWVGQVRIDSSLSRADNSSCFLISPTVDAPPVPLERASRDRTDSTLRVLDASELVRTLHVFLRRLERGEAAGDLQMGVECIDSAFHDLLQRLHRAYAQTTSRRHSRIKRHETVFICAGIGAAHFFTSGQRPLVSMGAVTSGDAPINVGQIATTAETDADEAYVALDEPGVDHPDASTGTHDSFRVDRWQVRDVSPQGLLLVQAGEPSVKFRVGDVLGIQRANVTGQWSIGLVRWLKEPGNKGVEVGVELIAPSAVAASLQAIVGGETPTPVPALLLPAVDVAHRPTSLLVPRSTVQVGKDLFLNEANRATRRVRVLDVIERTGSVEQVIVGNVIE